MNAVTTVLMAMLVAPNTWCAERDQMLWKIRLEAPERKKAKMATLRTGSSSWGATILAWVERRSKETNKKVGGSKEVKTTATYEKKWTYYEAGKSTGKSVALVGAGPASLAAAVTAVIEAAASPPSQSLTFFEVLTAAAFVDFARRGVTLAVVETGLGGRLDSTNVITPLVSVITVVELTKETAIYATNIGSWFVPGVLCGAMYLAMSLPLSRAARRLEQRWSPR